MSALTLVQEQKCFGGRQVRYKHQSAVLNCEMQFSVFLPPQAATQPVPALYWLSGLTCSDENFSVKAGAQRVAAELGIALSFPTPARAVTAWPTIRRTIWGRAPAFMSMPRRRRGRRSIIRCMITS